MIRNDLREEPPAARLSRGAVGGVLAGLSFAFFGSGARRGERVLALRRGSVGAPS